MRFDWYQATIPEDALRLVDALQRFLGPGGEVFEGRGLHNYHRSFTVRDTGGDVVAQVLADGPNGHPNVKASGSATDAFVELVRSSWPEHRVTRMDAAEDFRDPGAYEAAEGICRRVGRELGVRGRAIVPDDASEGRTYYLGAPSSDVRVRLYDKTAEVRSRLPEVRHCEVPDHWVRLEAQVRPRKDARVVAAQVPPEAAWGFAGWTSSLAREVFALDVERVSMQAGRETDHERARRFMVMQYRRVLERMLDEVGSWERVGVQLGGDVRKLKRERGRL